VSRPPGLWADTRPTELDDAPPRAARERELTAARREADAAARAELLAKAHAARTRRRRILAACAAASVLLVLGLLVGRGLGGDSETLPAAGPQLPPERASDNAIGRVYAAAGPGVVSVQVQQGAGTATGAATRSRPTCATSRPTCCATASS
jgi:hypothetical protein